MASLTSSERYRLFTSLQFSQAHWPSATTDFLSMYPTVNNLMGLWRFVTARKITKP
jgi:hypothetical protein